jgi:hypothetical protein
MSHFIFHLIVFGIGVASGVALMALLVMGTELEEPLEFIRPEQRN